MLSQELPVQNSNAVKNVRIHLIGYCQRFFEEHPVVYFRKPSIRPRGYKTLFMLNSAEHGIFKCKYENIKKFSIFQAQIGLECYFSC